MAEDTLTDIHRLLIRRLSAAIGRQLNTSAAYICGRTRGIRFIILNL